MDASFFRWCRRCGGFLVASDVEGYGGELSGDSFCVWRCVNCGEYLDHQVLANRQPDVERSLTRRPAPRTPAGPTRLRTSGEAPGAAGP